jgi:PmbA protein
VARWAAANIEAARAEAAEVILSGEVSAGWAEAAMASSTGILLARRSSSLHVGMMALLRDGSGVGSYYEYDLGRRLADVQPETVAVLATRQAAAYRRATPGPTGRMPVVLGPNAAYELICEVGDAAEADGIQRGRSVFAGRLGRRIGSPLLTLTDDGLIPAGVYSADRDGEGAPRRRVQICREGVLTGLLHSSYTAHKAGVPNTGHADRGGGISPTQLQLARGSRSAAQIIADVGRGLYVEHVDLDPDTASGQISATADYALRIENGRLTRPVRNTMLAGDLFEWLAALDAVSSDFRAEPGLAMPTVRLADVQVVGGRTS